MCVISSIRRTNNTPANVNPTPTATVRSNITVNANVTTNTPKSLRGPRHISRKLSHSPIRNATTSNTALNTANGMCVAKGAANSTITSNVNA